MSNDALALIKQYADQKSTGNLVLKKFNGEYEDIAYVYLNKGRIYSTLINQEFPPIGARIFSSGLVDPHDFSRIMESAGGDANDPSVYTALLKEDLFPERVLHNYIKDEFLSAMRVILSWTDVEYEWRTGDASQAFIVAPISLRAVFEKVNDNLDKIAGMMEEIYIMTGENPNDEDLEHEVDAENVVPYPLEEPSEEDISSEEYSFFKKIDGRNKISTICENFGYVTLPALRNTYSLWRKGYVGLNLYGNSSDTYDPEIIEAYDHKDDSTDNELEDEVFNGAEEYEEANTEVHLPEEDPQEEDSLEEGGESIEKDEIFFIDEEDAQSFDHAPLSSNSDFAEEEEEEGSHKDESPSDDEFSFEDSESYEEENAEDDEANEENLEEALEDSLDAHEEDSSDVDEETVNNDDMSEYVNQIMGSSDEEHIVDSDTTEDNEEDEVKEDAPTAISLDAQDEQSDDEEHDGDDYLMKSLRGMEKDLHQITERIESLKEEEEIVLDEIKYNENEIISLQEKIKDLEEEITPLKNHTQDISNNVKKLTRSKDTLTKAYNAIVESVSDS